MQLAKPAVDLGLYTNQRDEMLRFWQERVALPFDELLPLGNGVQQHRHRIGNSILKINHSRNPLPSAPRSGYRELLLAREDVDEPHTLEDPDGNLVTLVPTGFEGIDQLGVRIAVRDLEAERRFLGSVLGLPDATEHAGGPAFRCGASLLILAHDRYATCEPEQRAPGYRYLTFQVFDVVREHAAILAQGGREGLAPIRLGDVAYISFVRDPAGNWIEISQRKSITGSLD